MAPATNYAGFGLERLSMNFSTNPVLIANGTLATFLWSGHNQRPHEETANQTWSNINKSNIESKVPFQRLPVMQRCLSCHNSVKSHAPYIPFNDVAKLVQKLKDEVFRQKLENYIENSDKKEAYDRMPPYDRPPLTPKEKEAFQELIRELTEG